IEAHLGPPDVPPGPGSVPVPSPAGQAMGKIERIPLVANESPRSAGRSQRRAGIASVAIRDGVAETSTAATGTAGMATTGMAGTASGLITTNSPIASYQRYSRYYARALPAAPWSETQPLSYRPRPLLPVVD